LTELSVKIGGRTCRLLAERVFGDAGDVILGRSEKAQTRGLMTVGKKSSGAQVIGKRIGGYSSVAIPEI
jgi:hypothetical protein